jgi:hypothetical protein
MTPSQPVNGVSTVGHSWVSGGGQSRCIMSSRLSPKSLLASISVRHSMIDICTGEPAGDRINRGPHCTVWTVGSEQGASYHQNKLRDQRSFHMSFV